MGFHIRYEGGSRILTSEDTYPEILPVAKRRARAYNRTVVIIAALDFSPQAIVQPDGSVSSPPEGYQG